MLDLAIIGSGPAALSAALYAARAGLNTQVYGTDEPGGTLNQIDTISNYPGFKGSGRDLAKQMRRQAESAGAKVAYGECQDIQLAGDKAHPHYTLTIDDESIAARSVLVATGSCPRPLDFDVQPPVSYCALCDSTFAKGKRVIIVGGGNSAVQEAIYLAPEVKELTLITRSVLKADSTLREQLASLKNVTIREQTPASPELVNSFEYAFVFIGKMPATTFLRGLETRTVFDKTAGPIAIEITKDIKLLDSDGYIITGGKSATPHQSAIPGIFAAGDVRQGTPKQVITAAGDGAAAAIEIAHFLQK